MNDPPIRRRRYLTNLRTRKRVPQGADWGQIGGILGGGGGKVIWFYDSFQSPGRSKAEPQPEPVLEAKRKFTRIVSNRVWMREHYGDPANWPAGWPAGWNLRQKLRVVRQTATNQPQPLGGKIIRPLQAAEEGGEGGGCEAGCGGCEAGCEAGCGGCEAGCEFGEGGGCGPCDGGGAGSGCGGGTGSGCGPGGGGGCFGEFGEVGAGGGSCGVCEIGCSGCTAAETGGGPGVGGGTTGGCSGSGCGPGGGGGCFGEAAAETGGGGGGCGPGGGGGCFGEAAAETGGGGSGCGPGGGGGCFGEIGCSAETGCSAASNEDGGTAGVGGCSGCVGAEIGGCGACSTGGCGACACSEGVGCSGCGPGGGGGCAFETGAPGPGGCSPSPGGPFGPGEAPGGRGGGRSAGGGPFGTFDVAVGREDPGVQLGPVENPDLGGRTPAPPDPGFQPPATPPAPITNEPLGPVAPPTAAPPPAAPPVDVPPSPLAGFALGTPANAAPALGPNAGYGMPGAYAGHFADAYGPFGLGGPPNNAAPGRGGFFDAPSLSYTPGFDPNAFYDAVGPLGAPPVGGRGPTPNAYVAENWGTMAPPSYTVENTTPPATYGVSPQGRDALSAAYEAGKGPTSFDPTGFPGYPAAAPAVAERGGKEAIADRGPPGFDPNVGIPAWAPDFAHEFAPGLFAPTVEAGRGVPAPGVPSHAPPANTPFSAPPTVAAPFDPARGERDVAAPPPGWFDPTTLGPVANPGKAGFVGLDPSFLSPTPMGLQAQPDFAAVPAPPATPTGREPAGPQAPFTDQPTYTGREGQTPAPPPVAGLAPTPGLDLANLSIEFASPLGLAGRDAFANAPQGQMGGQTSRPVFDQNTGTWRDPVTGQMVRPPSSGGKIDQPFGLMSMM